VGSKPGILGIILGYLFRLKIRRRKLIFKNKRKVVFRTWISSETSPQEPMSSILGFFRLSPGRALKSQMQRRMQYVDDQLEAKLPGHEKGRASWLQERIQELPAAGVDRREKPCWKFKKSNNIVDTGGRLIGEQQLAELNSQIVIARAGTAEAKARLDRISDITKEWPF